MRWEELSIEAKKTSDALIDIEDAISAVNVQIDKINHEQDNEIRIIRQRYAGIKDSIRKENKYQFAVSRRRFYIKKKESLWNRLVKG